ncbi:MAG: DUF1499 domain-containing protein [Planctomycetales bacterium]
MTDQANAALIDGKLRPCPDSPNCVCSEHLGTAHFVEPLEFSGDADEAWARLIGIVKQQPRTTMVIETADYIETRVKTRFFRFEDLLEFRLDRAVKQIHVRSASKVGSSDLGTNRRRIETLRRLFREE